MASILELKVNGKVVEILQPIEKVDTMSIQHPPGWPIHINSQLTKPVSEWLYSLTQQVEGANIKYNGTYMTKEDVNKPSHMK